MSESYAFYEAHIRADWQDWTFGAHQAAARTAAAEELIALRRQYTEMAEQDLVRLADSWRSDDASGPYFTFAAASAHGGVDGNGDSGSGGSGRGDSDDDRDGPETVAVSATFVKELFRQLDDQTPAALAALLDQWFEQRRYAAHAGMRQVPVRPPRVSVLLPRDASRWPPESWDGLLSLDLDAPRFDGTLLHWDGESGRWLARSIRPG